MGALDEALNLLRGLEPAKLDELKRGYAQAVKAKPWVPNPGPQTQAYLSQADILLYGGQAAGGKTHLVVGWGINESDNGIIFRRELGQTDGLEKEGKSVIGKSASFNGQDREWTWPDGKNLKLGGMKEIDSWMAHAGRERDYLGFDEGGEFVEDQVGSIMAWVRAAPGKRARIIIASNPPRTADGYWLIEWFAPWLDEKHYLYPAEPGKLLWACYVSSEDGTHKTYWVDGPGEYKFDGEPYTAKSRTFIPASLEDNPYRNTPEYRATLQNLPEPLRSQLLYGNWKAGQQDQANQCIPTEWVRAAIKRWTDRPEEHIPQCTIAADCTGGGNDPLVLARRHDGWYAPLVKIPGKEIPQDSIGSQTAGQVIAYRRDDSTVVLDMGGGYGGSAQEHLKSNGINAYPYRGSESTERRSRDSKLGFTNVRSAAYWAFREALDPGQPGGSPIKLPDDSRLVAGLTAPTFEVTPQGIKVQPKIIRNEKGKVTGGVMAKLGFSPDEADAVVMAWWAGPKEVNSALDWAERKLRMKRGPKVILGKAGALAQKRAGVR